jgi:putative transposase
MRRLWQRLKAWLAHWRRRRCKPYRRKQATSSRHYRRKPAWVTEEVIRIHRETRLSSRKTADTFNRLHDAAGGMRVGKSFVAKTLLVYRYQAGQLSERFKHHVPPPLPCNQVWGVDMTGKGDKQGTMCTIFGVIDYGSRMALTLHTLRDRAAITLLRALLDAMDKHGKPATIKTDNEACFTSRWFRFGLRWLGIRHQRSKAGCPWQNGRIERLFGTLKEKLDQLVVDDRSGLQLALNEFRVWYNQVRPHQHLDGWTPWEAWCGVNPYRRAPKAITFFSAWEGLLTGYHMRR